MEYTEWREGVLDVADQENNPSWAKTWEGEERDWAFYRAGEVITEENGADYYGGEITQDDVWEEASSVIGLWAISFYSSTYEVLDKWYASIGKILSDEVRNYFEDGEYMYFVSGAQYDIIDADLLGGSGDGTTREAFMQFLQTV